MVGALLAATGLLAVGCGGSSKSSSGTTVSPGTTGSAATGSATTAGGGSAAAIKIGFISSETGPASSSYVGSIWGAQARVDALNAAGGVNGHKIQLIAVDDASSPAGNLTAAQLLVDSDKVFGVIEDTSFTFASYKFLNQQGVPVTGAAIDGPEWAMPPNSNMFSVSAPIDGSVGGSYYTYDNEAKFLKSLGVTKLAGVVYSIESAIQSMGGLITSAEVQGISKCYVNNSIPFGDTDFTAVALQIKSLGCDGATGVSLLATDIAFSGALKQGGINAQQIYPTAYDQNLLSNPSALQAMAGDYTTASINFQVPNAAAQTMLNDLKQYTKFPGGIPSLNIVQGYTGADLMSKGLSLAGSTPTRRAFISNLRQVANYDAGGLYPSAVTFQNFGTAGMLPPTSCTYIFKITTTGYTAVNNNQPVCGNLVKVPAAHS
jgi:branched-chain amino acid transport system substrate-binding protein